MPAVGGRNPAEGGAIASQGFFGNYWASTQADSDPANGYSMQLSSGVRNPRNDPWKPWGMSIRCVR